MRRLVLLVVVGLLAVLSAAAGYYAVLRWGLPLVSNPRGSDRRFNGALVAAPLAASVVIGAAALIDRAGHRSDYDRKTKGRSGGLPDAATPAESDGPSIRSAAPRPVRALERMHSWRFTNHPRTVQRVLSGSTWQETLRAIYPRHELVTIGGAAFPIWAEIAHPDDRRDVDAVIGNLDLRTLPSPGHYDRDGVGFDPRGAREFRHHYRLRDGKRRYDDPTFALDRIHRRGPGQFRIDARIGTYFQSLATSEMLEREFISACARHPHRPLTLADLPRRAWLHDKAGDDVVFNGAHRAAALSVAATIILTRPRGGYHALVSRRSNVVRTHPGFRHVFPSGILQPTDLRYRGVRDEYSIRRSLLREYAEELFGYDELTRDRGALSDSLRGLWPIQQLLAAADDGTAIIRYCGMSVPLLTLRPEVYVLIFVRDPHWFDDMVDRSRQVDPSHSFRLNWEFIDSRAQIAGQRFDSIRVPLDEDFHLIDDLEPWSPLNTVPHAAAALWLSTQVAADVVRAETRQA